MNDQSQTTLTTILAAMQQAEELGGVGTTAEYVGTMRAVAAEAHKRLAIAAGHGTAPGMPQVSLGQALGYLNAVIASDDRMEHDEIAPDGHDYNAAYDAVVDTRTAIEQHIGDVRGLLAVFRRECRNTPLAVIDKGLVLGFLDQIEELVPLPTGQAERDLDRYATPGERQAATRLVDALLAAGYSLRLNDGEEWLPESGATRERDAILDAMASTGEETICAYKPDGRSAGQVYLVYGNDPDGSELYADYTISLQALIDAIEVPA